LTARVFFLVHAEARKRALEAIQAAPEGVEVRIKPPNRTSAQNRLLWATLADLSEQAMWHGHKLTPTEWKDLLSAGLRKQRAVPGIDGGFVVLGERTSQYTKQEMSDLIELAHAVGIPLGVQFKD
jgi:hypothetical protein